MRNSRCMAVVAAAVTLACLLAACASTSQGREAKVSGFLGDYSQLKPGQEGQALWIYVDPSADFSAYNAILMDPITVYSSAEDSALAKVPLSDMQGLVNYFDATIREHLAGDYKFVTKPGPGVMRLRVAISEAKGAKVVLSTVSAVTPVGLALNGLKKGVTGASTGVGKTGVEMELVDSQSAKRLAAAIDERVGAKTSSFGEWQSAKDAFDFWAAQLEARLQELRAK